MPSILYIGQSIVSHVKVQCNTSAERPINTIIIMTYYNWDMALLLLMLKKHEIVVGINDFLNRTCLYCSYGQQICFFMSHLALP